MRMVRMRIEAIDEGDTDRITRAHPQTHSLKQTRKHALPSIRRIDTHRAILKRIHLIDDTKRHTPAQIQSRQTRQHKRKNRPLRKESLTPRQGITDHGF